jgi:hypothetical protein
LWTYRDGYSNLTGQIERIHKLVAVMVDRALDRARLVIFRAVSRPDTTADELLLEVDVIRR